MENKRCYIAGKITGYEHSQAILFFEVAKMEVERLGLIPVSPMDLPHQHGGTWEEYMREDLMELLKCKYLYAITTWQHSPGARFEVHAAMTLGMEIIFQPKHQMKIEYK